MKLILMMAMTVDGIIAKDKNQNADWTTKADKKAFIAETKKHGAIIMGDTTFEAMGRKSLPGRLNFILSFTPEKYKEVEVPGQLEFYKGSTQEIVDCLANKGFESVILGGGASVNASFLEAGLVDEILITVEPKVFGRGMNFTEGKDLDLNLKLLEVNELGEEAVQLRYQIIK